MCRRYGRKRPYSEIGTARLPCFRCGARPSRFQWQSCVDGNLYHPVCEKCDLELNWLVLQFFGYPHARTMLREYRKRIRRT